MVGKHKMLFGFFDLPSQLPWQKLSCYVSIYLLVSFIHASSSSPLMPHCSSDFLNRTRLFSFFFFIFKQLLSFCSDLIFCRKGMKWPALSRLISSSLQEHRNIVLSILWCFLKIPQQFICMYVVNPCLPLYFFCISVLQLFSYYWFLNLDSGLCDTPGSIRQAGLTIPNVIVASFSCFSPARALPPYFNPLSA